MNLDDKQKKGLLGVAIAICLLVAGSKIYKFYQSLQPPFAVGECFSVTDPRVGEVKFEVVENDKTNKVTTAVATIKNPFGLEGVSIQVPTQGSFDEIRESGAKKVSCE